MGHGRPAAPRVVGGFLAGKDPAPLFELAASREPLERRTAITAPLLYTRTESADDLATGFAVAAVLATDPDPVVHNAVGTFLKHAGERDRAALLAFLDQHAATMPRPAVRLAVAKLDPARPRAGSASREAEVASGSAAARIPVRCRGGRRAGCAPPGTMRSRAAASAPRASPAARRTSASDEHDLADEPCPEVRTAHAATRASASQARPASRSPAAARLRPMTRADGTLPAGVGELDAECEAVLDVLARPRSAVTPPASRASASTVRGQGREEQPAEVVHQGQALGLPPLRVVEAARPEQGPAPDAERPGLPTASPCQAGALDGLLEAGPAGREPSPISEVQSGDSVDPGEQPGIVAGGAGGLVSRRSASWGRPARAST